MGSGQLRKKVFLQTFGCQMNDYDSGKMLEQLHALHYTLTENPVQADLIVINTCAIREHAENKVYSLLGRLGELKNDKPSLKIAVGGCVAQQRGKEILRRAGRVDVVFGTDNIFELPRLLARAEQGERPVLTEWRNRKKKVSNFIPDLPEASFSAGVKANLAITKGCNNYCTFCVVPYTRGTESSREAGNIIAEAERLVQRGAKEITLLGQNVNSYKAGDTDFVGLLSQLNQVPGLERIRYISPHPKDFTRALAKAHSTLPKLCEQLHLPFQSGSDRILTAMRRNHSIAEYLEKLALVREIVPGIALSTDIIVGFPGETAQDFEATMEVVEAVGFEHIYAFKFSPRSQTPAACYAGQVSEAIKAERLARLLELHHAQLQKQHEGLVGSRQQVLLEGPHPRNAGAMLGRTRANKSTVVMNTRRKTGAVIGVDIIATRKYSLVGREVGP